MVDVIIIGAGFSSAIAAIELAIAGYKVFVLEARDRLGGRAYTTHVEHGSSSHVVDLGCSAIHGFDKGNPARQIAARLGVPVHVAAAGETIIYAPEGLLNADRANSVLADARAAITQPVAPEEEELLSLFDHAISQTADPSALKILRLNEIGAGITLETVSLKYWGWERNYAGVDGLPTGGYSALITQMWEEAKSKGVVVHLNEEVVKVIDLGRGVRIITKNKEHESREYASHTCLSTIPLGVLKASPPQFTPPLPSSTLDAIDRTSVGALNKVVLAYPEIWWPRADKVAKYIIIPTSLSHVAASPPSNVKDFLNLTTLSVDNLAFSHVSNPPLLLLAFGADAARSLEAFSDAEIKTAFHELLVQRLGVPEAGNVPAPSAVLVTRWSSDPYARGATSTPIAIPLNPSVHDRLQTPLDFITLSRSVWEDRLYFAGEHTDFDHHGSVAGALVSGKREARKIERYLVRQSLDVSLTVP